MGFMRIINDRTYDIIIIGAGPAGLGAAREAARLGARTLVLERRTGSGQLNHPGSAVISPIPGWIPGQVEGEEIYFPNLDLRISRDMILGFLSSKRYFSPGGYEISVDLSKGKRLPVAVVDKPALMQRLTESIQSKGVQVCYSNPASGLLFKKGRVVGVKTHWESFYSGTVISTEGVSRRFCEEAGLFDFSVPARGYLYIAGEEFVTPGAKDMDIGQIFHIGSRYIPVDNAIGSFLITNTGVASLYMMIFLEQPQPISDQMLIDNLQAYKSNEPRIQRLLSGSYTRNRYTSRITLRDAPEHVSLEGFIGAGDSVSSNGIFGILPAMFSGQQAVRSAVQSNKPRSLQKRAFNRILKSTRENVPEGLATENRTLIKISRLTDPEIDQLFRTFGDLDLGPLLLGQKTNLIRDSISWIFKNSPLMFQNPGLALQFFTKILQLKGG